MCGIFGIATWQQTTLRRATINAALDSFFRLSQRRGKEAAGLAVRTPKALSLFKRSMRASRMIRTRDYRQYVDQCLSQIPETNGALAGGFTVIGHARLVTNGRYGIALNNQPVAAGTAVAVHNGIIINHDALWREHGNDKRQAEVDTEIIPALLSRSVEEGADLATATRCLYGTIEGEANIAVLFPYQPLLLLATNTGSLYVAAGEGGCLVFASERPILEDFLRLNSDVATALGSGTIEHAKAGSALVVDLAGGGVQRFRLDEPAMPLVMDVRPAPVPLVDPVSAAQARRRNLKRCTRCILPETMPRISFDTDGVCNYCRHHRPFLLKGRTALEALADRHRRRRDGRADCVIGLSGGRDSSYGLHFLKRELGLNPIAYTYDWALVTDLARRNQSRLCAKLGVEHVLVSADIQAKRRYIRKNVNAWLHQPDLGMVPLFMAGDKMYFYYLQDVARRNDISLGFVCGNRFEMTDFKSGFAGVPTDPNAEDFRPYGVSAQRKLKLMLYYLERFVRNPRYLNTSLFDTAQGFYASYVMRHNLIWLYDYVPWDEAKIVRTLREVYDWEEASDTDNSWRIGDGTAAFYNYIYFTLAGFSEHDTFRSNQIRAGVIGRDEALTLVGQDNRPRYESIREYANVIGFDLDNALAAIDMAPKLY